MQQKNLFKKYTLHEVLDEFDLIEYFEALGPTTTNRRDHQTTGEPVFSKWVSRRQPRYNNAGIRVIKEKRLFFELYQFHTKKITLPWVTNCKALSVSVY